MHSGSHVTKQFLAPQAFQLIYQSNNVATQIACQGPKAPAGSLGGSITLSLTKASDGTLACSWYTL
ncbi:MAG: hypothetical protein JSR85_06160 [Proteobacteria bacterium]|nr:hypothetical protein [Pseudomonadota bacterium]